MRMDLEMKNTSNSDCTHCTIVVSLEMSDEPFFIVLRRLKHCESVHAPLLVGMLPVHVPLWVGYSWGGFLC